MKRSPRTLLIALVSTLAAACSQAPDAPIVADEVAAPAAHEAPRAAPALAAAEEPGGCELPPSGCDCQQGAEAAAAEAADAPIEEIALGAAPTRGPADAPVTIVVFADFECPFCVKAWRTLSQIEDEYPGKLRFAVKHKPLPFHAHARAAAKAAIAAQAQGRFWELHDALVDAKGELDDAAIEQHAAALGLDVGRLRRDARSAEVEAALAADDAEAQRLSVAGTPTLFVNGRRVIGAQPAEVLRAAIDRALAERAP